MKPEVLQLKLKYEPKPPAYVQKIQYFSCASRILLRSTSLFHLAFTCSHRYCQHNTCEVSLSNIIYLKQIPLRIHINFLCSVNINCYLSSSHFVIAYYLQDFRVGRVCGATLLQHEQKRFQFFFLKGFFGFSLSSGDVPEYFYELCRILSNFILSCFNVHNSVIA